MNKRYLLMVVPVLFLSGCGGQYTSNGEQHYMQSKNGRDPVIPPSLSSASISHFYDLPAQNQNAKVSINPPT